MTNNYAGRGIAFKFTQRLSLSLSSENCEANVREEEEEEALSERQVLLLCLIFTSGIWVFKGGCLESLGS